MKNFNMNDLGNFNDPSIVNDKNLMFEKLNNEINQIEKTINKLEKSNVEFNPQKKQEQNPFIDSFKEICGNDNELKGILDSFGGDFKDLFNGIDDKNLNKNTSDLMGILNNINESDGGKGGEMGNMSGVFDKII